MPDIWASLPGGTSVPPDPIHALPCHRRGPAAGIARNGGGRNRFRQNHRAMKVLAKTNI